MEHGPLGIRLTKIQGEIVCTQIVNPRISNSIHGLRAVSVNKAVVTGDWDFMVDAMKKRPLEIVFEDSRALSSEDVRRILILTSPTSDPNPNPNTNPNPNLDPNSSPNWRT